MSNNISISYAALDQAMNEVEDLQNKVRVSLTNISDSFNDSQKGIVTQVSADVRSKLTNAQENFNAFNKNMRELKDKVALAKSEYQKSETA